MADYTEVTSKGWFSRIGNSFVGALIGFVVFLGSFYLHYWNEGRAVDDARVLEAAGSSVISVAADKVDPANDGKLVHVTGKAEAVGLVKDPVFGLEESALRLIRGADMYQWEEDVQSRTRNKLGGGTETVKEYTYRMIWSSRPINSSSFFEVKKGNHDHANPSWPDRYRPHATNADKITLGAFQLSAALAGQIQASEPVQLDTARFDQLPEEIRKSFRLVDGQLYFGKGSPSSPVLGDIRIRFAAVKPLIVSIMAQQTGDTFRAQAFPGRNKTIEVLHEGNRSSTEMVQTEQAAARKLTWILRLVGFVLMGVGLTMVMGPLRVLADVIPFLGRAVGFVQGLIAFLIAGVLSLITIGICWIIHRPVVGVSILAAAGVVFAFTVWTIRSRKTNVAT